MLHQSLYFDMSQLMLVIIHKFLLSRDTQVLLEKIYAPRLHSCVGIAQTFEQSCRGLMRTSNFSTCSTERSILLPLTYQLS